MANAESEVQNKTNEIMDMPIKEMEARSKERVRRAMALYCEMNATVVLAATMVTMEGMAGKDQLLNTEEIDDFFESMLLQATLHETVDHLAEHCSK